MEQQGIRYMSVDTGLRWLGTVHQAGGVFVSLVPSEAARVQDVLQSQTKELDKANKVGNVCVVVISCLVLTLSVVKR